MFTYGNNEIRWHIWVNYSLFLCEMISLNIFYLESLTSRNLWAMCHYSRILKTKLQNFTKYQSILPNSLNDHNIANIHIECWLEINEHRKFSQFSLSRKHGGRIRKEAQRQKQREKRGAPIVWNSLITYSICV